MLRLLQTGLVTALGLVLATAAPVAADAAGPTDYLSEVTSVTPSVEGLGVGVIGGDSFLGLEVERGLEVRVAGYEGEPYLRFLADGLVQENRRSPAYVLNTDRYARGEVPADLTAQRATLDPLWVTVSRDGTWWWHDHRIHWMSDVPPLGLGPGDQVVDGVIPLEVVDGERSTAVQIRVTSTWQPEPSRVPVTVGFLLGMMLAVVGALVMRRSSRRGAVVAVFAVALVPAAAATVVGLWQFRSLPGATKPAVEWWLLPVTALVSSGAAAVSAWRGRGAWRLVVGGLVVLAAVQNARWVIERRSGLTRALLPTDAPWWFDRGVTAAVVMPSVAGVVVGGALIAVAVGPTVRRAGRAAGGP